MQPSDDSGLFITSNFLSMIEKRSKEIAILFLPGIQHDTGQLFDIATMTSHAKLHGLTIRWDLAHAVGNVKLSFHDCDIDFAV